MFVRELPSSPLQPYISTHSQKPVSNPHSPSIRMNPSSHPYQRSHLLTTVCFSSHTDLHTKSTDLSPSCIDIEEIYNPSPHRPSLPHRATEDRKTCTPCFASSRPCGGGRNLLTRMHQRRRFVCGVQRSSQ